jgi:uncharacterized protein (DUF608 family)
MVTVTFILAWYFPKVEKKNGLSERREKCVKQPSWENYYRLLWDDAWDVAKYVMVNLKRLRNETGLFHDTLFASTLPVYVLDAISSQLSTLNTNTCLRLDDGTFYGFEGCTNTFGCCEGSCTHVWNYAQALPYLFPNLQRSLIEAHFSNCVEPDGFMTFRMPLPLGTKAKPTFHPAADGQMGCILWVYREWLISGDDEWLRRMWPTVKKLLRFAWKYWDADKDGVMEGMQHNTYDVEFYGPNTMMGSLYLAALRSVKEIAKYFGEDEEASEYQRLFDKGSEWMDKNLFNEEYYEQQINPSAHESWPELYRNLALKHGKDDKFINWPRWQYGKGCLSDQLIGQWYAHMLRLGYLYDQNNVKSTMKSIFGYNWKPMLWNHPGTLRIFAVSDEAGLVVCTYPKGDRPGHAFYLGDEIWCGIEYQVASHMIYEDMIDEGLAIVMGVRNRHRGDRRNPWNEFECGHHYARSMASYSLLLALSGFSYSAPEKRLGFAPKIYKEQFRSFFSTESGWGLYEQKITNTEIEFKLSLKYGFLIIDKLYLPIETTPEAKIFVTIDSKDIEVKRIQEKEAITELLISLKINQKETLKVSIQR